MIQFSVNVQPMLLCLSPYISAHPDVQDDQAWYKLLSLCGRYLARIGSTSYADLRVCLEADVLETFGISAPLSRIHPQLHDAACQILLTVPNAHAYSGVEWVGIGVNDNVQLRFY